MNPMRRTSRLLIGMLLLTLASFTFSTCGVSGTDLAGGGSSGTGVSTGAITSFGSVEMNGVHYLTDNNTIKMSHGDDHSFEMDQAVFRVGMVVTIHHGPNDNNALEIDYRDNLQGLIAAKNSGADNTITVLGQTVVVSDAALFAPLNLNELVEVSGFVDSAGRIRATYIARNPQSPHHGGEIEVKGFVSGLSSSAASFQLGPLPDGTGMTVTVSFSPAVGAGLADGMYVQVVTTGAQPVSGPISATSIVELTPRTVFPDKAMVDLEGLVTVSPSGSGNALSFAVEGKRVQTDVATQYVGGTAANLLPDMRLQVEGTENGGVLSAARIIFR
jgi:Domain of unknown function (DUF5666)